MNLWLTESQDAVRIAASACPRPLRLLLATLFLTSRIALVVILGLLVLGFGNALSPPRLVRLLLYWVLLPAATLDLLRAYFAAQIEVRGRNLLLKHCGLFRRGQAIALSPSTGITLVPWRLPFPSPGLSVATGKAWAGMAVMCWNPAAVIAACRPAAVPLSDTTLARATMTYSAARAAAHSMHWRGYVLKFVLFPLLPAFIFFRLHQWIMYGGLLGQYYLHGLQPWLSSFAFHWIMSCAYLLLYASLWRGPAELVAYLVAGRSPELALPARHWAERVLAILYYGGVPLLIAARLLG
jgi:hypothetical protein